MLFAKDSERKDRPVSFEVSGNGKHLILVTDLAAGTWQILKNGDVYKPAVRVTEDAGTLYFEGDAGKYELRR